MQRIFSRRLVLKLSDDSCSLQACKTFTSLAKPVQTCHRNLLFSSSINHPFHPHWRSWESRHRFAERVYGFLSTPEIAKQFSMGSSNTLLRASRKSIADFRVCLRRAKMSGQSFQFNPRFENYLRGWRSWFRRLTTNDMVLGLIITNVAVFMLWRIADCRFMSKNFMVMEDNPFERTTISHIFDAANSLSSAEVVKDETGFAMKENTISQMGNSSDEAHSIVCRRKKLIILDVNGLLADFVAKVPTGYKPDLTISRKAVFKRPFCDDFLQFCFKQFEVGVWSSRMRKNLDMAVDFLMGDLRHKLLFCWDQSHCTNSGFFTVDNEDRPLFFKELRKIWEKLEPDLPWENGEFNASNTILLDDSPYKAMLNPVNTSIFTLSYCYGDSEDASLGPGGDLRVYLEGIAMAENVQKYIELNPFGQSPVTESHPSWEFYHLIVHSVCAKEEEKDNTSKPLPAL